MNIFSRFTFLEFCYLYIRVGDTMRIRPRRSWASGIRCEIMLRSKSQVVHFIWLATLLASH